MSAEVIDFDEWRRQRGEAELKALVMRSWQPMPDLDLEEDVQEFEDDIPF